jgi:thiamine biosynthesis lipoprotein
MGTLATISAWGYDETSTSETVNRAFEAMEKVDQLMSNYKPDSELSQVNRQAGLQPIKVSPETLEVIKASIYYSQLSDGAFDVTIAPLVKSWGFFKKQGRVPSQEEIQSKRALVDYKQIAIDEKESMVFLKRPLMEIDLGAIAKGYGVDKAVEELKKAGITAALVNLSGNIYAMGKPPDKPEWEVGVKDPKSKEEITGVISLKDKAISTSGNYENYFIIDGKRYGHLIDPKTGHPIDNKLLSVTVVAANAMATDALSTAIFILGKEVGKALIEKLDNVDAIIISETDIAEQKIWISEGLKKEKAKGERRNILESVKWGVRNTK